MYPVAPVSATFIAGASSCWSLEPVLSQGCRHAGERSSPDPGDSPDRGTAEAARFRQTCRSAARPTRACSSSARSTVGSSRPFEVPRLRCREDPLPQTPHVLPGGAPAHSVPARRNVLRSVHHHRGVQLAHRFRCPCPSSASRAHLTASAPLRARAPARYPASYPRRPARGASHQRPGFLPPFGHRHSPPGHPVPARDLGLPYGRLTGHTPGPGRGFHVSHLRDTTGVGAPSTPGTAVLLPAGCRARPAPAASQRPVPAPRTCIPPAGLRNYGASTGVHAIHPSGLPLTCDPPDGTGGPWAFPCAPHPAVTGGARQAGPRREHAPGTTRPTSSASNPRVHSHSATSCRNGRCGRHDVVSISGRG